MGTPFPHHRYDESGVPISAEWGPAHHASTEPLRVVQAHTGSEGPPLSSWHSKVQDLKASLAERERAYNVREVRRGR